MAEVLSAAQVQEIGRQADDPLTALGPPGRYSVSRLARSHEQLRAMVARSCDWREIDAAHKAELEQLRGERDAAVTDVAYFKAHAKAGWDLSDRNEESAEAAVRAAGNAAAREALEFYADPATYEEHAAWPAFEKWCADEDLVEDADAPHGRAFFAGFGDGGRAADARVVAAEKERDAEKKRADEANRAALIAYEDKLAAEAAVRAGGNAADALRALVGACGTFYKDGDYYANIAPAVAAAREALAVLEPDGEREADLRRLRDPSIPPDIREAFAEQLLEDAAPHHTEARGE